MHSISFCALLIDDASTYCLLLGQISRGAEDNNHRVLLQFNVAILWSASEPRHARPKMPATTSIAL